MKIAIHQPNFIPHLPYFHKMEQCDLFVFLTHCQYEKNNYQNRFHNGDIWNTCRVPKKPSTCSIAEKQYIDFEKDFQKIRHNPENKNIKIPLEALQAHYNIIKHNLSNPNNLAEINMRFIRFIYAWLFREGILKRPLPKIVVDYKTELTKTERLVDLVKHYGGDTYLSGISGIKYMDMNQWYDNNISVVPMPKPDESDMINSLEKLNESITSLRSI